MHCSSPARHISSEPRLVVRPSNRWTAVAVLALGVAISAYDRVVFAFDGDRPGYRVAYDDRAGDEVLTVTISHVKGPREQRLTPHTEAVTEIVQHPDRNLVTEIVIELTDGAAGARPVFRVGLDVGSFYVDIGHPDRIAPPGGENPARTAAGHEGARTGHSAGAG